MKNNITKQQKFLKGIAIPLVLLVSLFLGFFAVINTLANSNTSRAYASDDLLYETKPINDDLDIYNSIPGSPDPTLPWFSGTFVQYLNLNYSLKSSVTVEDIQNHLNQEKDWYFIGGRCFSILPYLLSYGVSFEGVTLHLLQNFTLEAPFTHVIVGDPEHPFNGTFNGAGFTLTMGVDFNSMSPGSIDSTAHVALFGVIKDATVKNLRVVASPGNNVEDCNVAGIVAEAEDSLIFNCSSNIDFSGIDGTPANIGAIVGTSTNTKLVNCIDESDCTGGLVGNVVDETTDENLINSINYTAWDAKSGEEQIEFIKDMNFSIFNSYLYSISENSISTERLFWGIDGGGYPLFNSPDPIFDEAFVFEMAIKEDVLNILKYLHEDTLAFIEGDNETAIAARDTVNELYTDYKESLDLIVIEDPNLNAFMVFFDKTSALTRSAIRSFDDAYWDWAIVAAKDNETIFKDATLQSVLVSYEDNKTFIDKNAYGGIDSLKALEAKYNEFLDMMQNEESDNYVSIFTKDSDDKLEIKNLMDFFVEIKTVETNIIKAFDDIFWEWSDSKDLVDATALKLEKKGYLKDVFDDIMDNIKDDEVSAKVESVYLAALTAIDDESIEDSNWNTFAYNVATIVNQAEAEFNRLEAEWQNERRIETIIIVVSIIGGLLVLGAIAWIIVYLKRKNRKFNIYDIDEEKGREAELVREKADLTSRIFALQRERTEMIAQTQREKTKLLSDARTEKNALLAKAMEERASAEKRWEKEREDLKEQLKKSKEKEIPEKPVRAKASESSKQTDEDPDDYAD